MRQEPPAETFPQPRWPNIGARSTINDNALGPPFGPPSCADSQPKRAIVVLKRWSQRRSTSFSLTFGGPIRSERAKSGHTGQFGYIDDKSCITDIGTVPDGSPRVSSSKCFFAKRNGSFRIALSITHTVEEALILAMVLIIGNDCNYKFKGETIWSYEQEVALKAPSATPRS